MTARIAVLASGRGSNLLAMLDAIARGDLDAEVVGVFSDKPDATALQRVPADARWSRDAKTFADRESFDADLADAVAASQPDWIVCAGYMRILGEAFV
ncbi:MAG: formyltransferase family protein, partial [Thermomonas sp.]